MGLRRREPNASNPPNSHEGSGGRGRGKKPEPVDNKKPDEIKGPKDGPDEISR